MKSKGLRLDSRHKIVEKARDDFHRFWNEWVDRHGITPAEEMNIIACHLSRMAVHAVKYERETKGKS